MDLLIALLACLFYYFLLTLCDEQAAMGTIRHDLIARIITKFTGEWKRLSINHNRDMITGMPGGNGSRVYSENFLWTL